MSNLAFDTHQFVKDLTKAGMKNIQAEVLANQYARLLTDKLATKDDLAGFKHELRLLKHDLKRFEERLNSKMMITISSAQIVTIVTICTVTGLLLSLN